MINNLGYKGIIKASIIQNNRILSTKVYHNSGCLSLFKFIGYCLAGEFDAAKVLRPYKIKLFCNGYTYAEADLNKRFLPSATNNLIVEASPFITTNTDAVVESTEETVDSATCSTTLHFRIPYAFINTAITSGNNSGVNEAIIYNSKDEPCAYFLFLNSEGNDWKNILSETSAKASYTLIIDWTMKISNNTGE